RTRMVRHEPLGFGREAKSERDLERLQRAHHTVEPSIRTGAQAVRPAQPRAQVADAEPAQPSDRVVQAMILEVEPLADPELRRVPGKARERDLRGSVLTHESHVEMTVVGGA